MALNKYMHPRNIYRIPPDFSKLAKTYKEFSDIAKMDVTGKVSINFKDPLALKILTKCLLKSDFNLDVNIPEDRLVPTLPLRLNYILWIEDLMNAIDLKIDTWGIDIGTGACAIYPLLAAVKNKWHMIGTETDDESLKRAMENVERNNLQHLIEVRKNATTTVLNELLLNEKSHKFHFCMCNPPFYMNVQELWESRSPARPEPKNGFTGSPHELITEGGELQFCRKIIEESKIHKNKVLIFTTMVGHKYNLNALVIDLKTDNIKHTVTEFCQGRVTRWGLAWTYQDYDFSQLKPIRDKLRKKNVPISFILPEVNQSSDPLEKLKVILQDLKIDYKIITKRNNEITFDIVALSNTWSNQRRKRRHLKHLDDACQKRHKIEAGENIGDILSTHQFNAFIANKHTIAAKENPVSTATNTVTAATDMNENTITTAKNESKVSVDVNKSSVSIASSENTVFTATNEGSGSMNANDSTLSTITNERTVPTVMDESTISTATIESNGTMAANGSTVSTTTNGTVSTVVNENTVCTPTKHTANDEFTTRRNESTKITTNDDNSGINSKTEIVHALLKIVFKEKMTIVETQFLNGCAGKEGLHQIAQYIKNNWKY